MLKADLKYAIALSLIPGVGAIAAKKLIAYCGGPEAVLKERKGALLKIPGIGQKIAESIQSSLLLERAEQEILFLEREKINAYYYLNKDYPQRLLHCEDSPILLFSKGNIHFNTEKMIAIVGTRNATVKGKLICEKIIGDLAKHQPTIVSGLAYGIDIAAHKAALSSNLATIAVLASGLDEIYPKSHSNVAEKMLHKGGLVSDYFSQTKILPTNFAERNRIVAGLVDAVVVIESSSKGGSLITADLANGYNRDVFAVPGRPSDSQSTGCNQLIKKNKAALIESAADIEYLLGWEIKTKKNTTQRELFVELSPEEEKILNAFQIDETKGVDELSLIAGLTISQTAISLLSLEFKGIIQSLPGKMYRII